jgi:hypothetical protein
MIPKLIVITRELIVILIILYQDSIAHIKQVVIREFIELIKVIVIGNRDFLLCFHLLEGCERFIFQRLKVNLDY